MNLRDFQKLHMTPCSNLFCNYLSIWLVTYIIHTCSFTAFVWIQEKAFNSALWYVHICNLFFLCWSHWNLMWFVYRLLDFISLISSNILYSVYSLWEFKSFQFLPYNLEYICVWGNDILTYLLLDFYFHLNSGNVFLTVYLNISSVKNNKMYSWWYIWIYVHTYKYTFILICEDLRSSQTLVFGFKTVNYLLFY